MLRSFKIRMLLVIVLVTIVALIMETNHFSKDYVESTLSYIMQDDDRIEQVVAVFTNREQQNKDDDISNVAVPAGSSNANVIQIPCNFESIEKSYGWYWNSEKNRQEFSPGVLFAVEDNTLVKPVLRGTVVEITGASDERKVKVQHNDYLFTIYGGIKEVLVKENSVVEPSEYLGKTSTKFYFELRNQDGPLNPLSIFE
ncbi:hypothetical protein SYNTR_1447 [Candidatus Syntrophocurvum alkaliphilum]|uniref:M23ase beta-sheet core domain-containing protein n=1 Tax=Candidatus Syntrophocurvum alkaliphilum TaxID=2293317 RepID=A0A6I6DIF9_9FIRM|nr:M23 family metallopeptidase [Candidatus Syntrophocurvum alkaliphilum]QGU00041.1 hypothetical protein SYNTR_1447 [Candidatus Syntrophocurvum alkaliphilum]